MLLIPLQNGAERRVHNATCHQRGGRRLRLLDRRQMAQMAQLAPSLRRARPVAPAESRSRGVRPRRDDALPGRDRRRQRDPRRRATSTASRTRRSTAPRSRSTQGEPVDAITLADELEERGELEDVGGRVAHPRAGGARPGDRERRPLRAHRPRDGDAARARSASAARSPARLGPPGRDARPRRPGRAARLRALAATASRASSPTSSAAEGELRADHRALRGGRRRHGHAVRLPRPRPAHVRLPAGQPDHHRGAPVDGEVGARALHGGEPRRAPGHAGRAVHARDVEVRGDAAADVQRGEGRVAAAAHRQARAGRLAAAHRRVRQAREGADLRRRHAARST